DHDAKRFRAVGQGGPLNHGPGIARSLPVIWVSLPSGMALGQRVWGGITTACVLRAAGVYRVIFFGASRTLGSVGCAVWHMTQCFRAISSASVSETLPAFETFAVASRRLTATARDFMRRLGYEDG